MFSNQIRSHNTKLTLTFLKSNLLIGLLHKNNYHHTRCYNLLKTNFSRFRRIKRQTNSKLTMYCPSCTSCIRGFSLATCSGVAAITWNWLFVSSWTVCVMSPPCTFKVRPLKADAHPPHLKWHSLGVLFLFCILCQAYRSHYMSNDGLKCVVSCKDVPFGGQNDVLNILF